MLLLLKKPSVFLKIICIRLGNCWQHQKTPDHLIINMKEEILNISNITLYNESGSFSLEFNTHGENNYSGHYFFPLDIIRHFLARLKCGPVGNKTP